MTETAGYADGPRDLQLSCAVHLSDNDKTLDLKDAKPRRVISGDNLERKKLHKRLMLLLTKPSYTLALGFMNARHENRIKLRYLLRKLVRQQNWVETSGVLSTLLKGTCKEGSLQNNRMKYWVAMEVLRHVETDVAAYSKEIEKLYSTWMGKIHSWKNKPLKDKYAKLESILSVLAHSTTSMPGVVPAAAGVLASQEVLRVIPDEQTLLKKLSNAREDARSLTLERESANDPVTNLVIGLTFYEDWYYSVPKEMQLKNLDDWCMPMDSETVGHNYSEEVEDMKWDDAASIYETHSNLDYHSETSVVNNKDNDGNFGNCRSGEAYGANLPVVPHQEIQAQGFYANSIETSTDIEGSVQDHYDKMQVSSVFNVHGMQSLLPIRLPSSEDMVDVLSCYGRSFDGTYKNALKHLQLAFESASPVSEAALLPMIQLLLLGDKTKEALVVLDKSCSKSKSMFPFRLRAHLWECFYANDSDKLLDYLEDVLKKDPACRYSLARLVSLHQKGDYVPERLVEMMALHLEATYPDYNTWRQFASCLLRISWCEEDRASTCVDGDEANCKKSYGVSFSRIPDMFVRGLSGKTWKLRCKWWLNRHFSKETLASDMSAGDLQLMTYKAACASHLYGKQFQYVTKVDTFLNEQDKTLSTCLHLHIRNSTGFYPSLVRKRVSF